MAKDKEFKSGDVVKVRGKPGTHSVSFSVMLAVPVVRGHQFLLEDVEMLKFVEGKETFCAYASDVTRAAPAKPAPAKKKGK